MSKCRQTHLTGSINGFKEVETTIMNKKYIQLITLILTLYSGSLLAEKYKLSSPNGKLKVEINSGEKIHYSLYHDNKLQIESSEISIDFVGIQKKDRPQVKESRKSKVRQVVYALYGNNRELRDDYNKLDLQFDGNYSLELRAYNSGIAFRWMSNFDENRKVRKEIVDVNLIGNPTAYVTHPLENSFLNSYEEFYSVSKLQSVSDSLIMLPVLFDSDDLKIAVTESDLYNYPALYFQKNKKSNGIEATFPQYPLETKVGGHRDFDLIVAKRAEYIADVAGSRSYPWRVFIVVENDSELLSNDLVYLLNREADPDQDFSWVQPGKVAWDWWNDNNLAGVPFKSGINTETYKYFVDFAAKNGIEYINIDEGWSSPYDLSDQDYSPDLNLAEVMEYANSKNVGVFLWCIARVLDQDMDSFMQKAALWGAKGLKVDFMDRDDQLMVNFYERAAKTAAKHKLLLNFHGAYKPTGMHRQYPNIISHEAVRGLEYNKFDPSGSTPEHALTIPFIRALAGYMDYTPGAMVNVQKEDFTMNFSRPVSQGTRCHQLAMYVMYNSQLVMLADAPTRYEREEQILGLLSSIPTSWDETMPLDGKVSDFAILARRYEGDWWVAGMTDWTARSLEVDFSFLDGESYQATIISDGPNADRLGEDFVREYLVIDKSSKKSFNLAPGGGFIIHLSKQRNDNK